MNDPKDPERAETEVPAENNRPMLDDDILKDEEPIREPQSEEPEEFPGDEDEDEDEDDVEDGQSRPPDPPMGGPALAY